MQDQHESALSTPRTPGRVFTCRALLVLGLAAGFVVLFFFLWYARWVFLLAFAGLLFAVFLQTLASWVHRLSRLPYGWSLVVVVALLVAVVILLASLVGVRLANQIGELSQAVPESLTHLRKQIEQSAWGKWIVQQLPPPSQVLSQTNFLSQVSGITSGALNGVVGVLVVLFVGLYGAAQPDWYRRSFLALFPSRRRGRAEEVLKRALDVLRWWVAGQSLAMVVVGLLTGVGLWLLGAPLPLALGLLAFAFEIIPNIGPFLSAIPAVLLARTHDPMLAVYVILLYVGIQAVESYVLMPLIQSRVIQLPPAIQILAVLILGMLAGILGALLAAPLVITVMILIKMLYIEDVLGEQTS